MLPKGSAEEQIRQELQAVAEGVAASVLCSSGPSTPPISQQSGDFRPVNVDIQQRDEFEVCYSTFSCKHVYMKHQGYY